MESVKRNYIKIILYNMVLSSYFTIGLSGKLDIPFNIIFLLGIILSFPYGERSNKKKGNPLLTLFTFIFFFIFFGTDYIFYSGDIILSTVHTAILALILKLFNIKSGRDYFYIFLLSFSIILISTTIVFDIYFFLCLLWFLTSSLILTMLYEIRSSSLEVDREQKGEIFTLSAWDKFFKKYNLNISPFTKTAILALLIMLLFTIPIFFTMPRFSFTAFDINLRMNNYISGFSNETDIGDVGKILKNSKIVMRVATDKSPSKIPEWVKWRGIALDNFDGRRWYVSPSPEKILRKSSRRHLFYILKRNNREILLKSTFYLEPGISEVIFTPWRPIALDINLKTLILTKTDSIKSITPIFKKFRYTVFADINRPGMKELKKIEEIDLNMVPPQTLKIPHFNKKIYDLVLKITGDKKTPLEKVLAIENYLKKNYRYSLNLNPIPEGKDPIYHFLFVSKKGYCEYFASAMALMVRYIKIPSRLVNGFRRGDYNPFSKTFVVRELHAHSWVEIFFNQYGWISFDPTPPSSEIYRESYISNLIEAIRFFWIRNIINYDFSDQFRLFWKIHTKTVDYKKNFKKFRENLLDRVANYLQGKITISDMKIKPIFYRKRNFFIMTIIFFLIFSSILIFKRLSGREKVDNECTKIFLDVLKELEKLNLKKGKWETPMEFSKRIKEEKIGEEFIKIVKIYYDCRFGGIKNIEKLREKAQKFLKKLKANSKVK